ncbi:hypothetical protein E2C01_009740 [Portunus trituberculatus]|uniref:Uncharacterized protein n=1 Tax=Portunus trituberculatus TaxID=210409 RepID=A0A5B7D6L4_PORTR|nr:hypothetical protein [Portunus trituberculatus]
MDLMRALAFWRSSGFRLRSSFWSRRDFSSSSKTAFALGRGSGMLGAPRINGYFSLSPYFLVFWDIPIDLINFPNIIYRECLKSLPFLWGLYLVSQKSDHSGDTSWL